MNPLITRAYSRDRSLQEPNQSVSTMAHENRIHQLEDIANKIPHNEGKYQDLVDGKMSTSSSQNGATHLVPVPVTLKAQLGSPVRIRIFKVSIFAKICLLDSVSDWGICDDSNNTCSVFDGMERSHSHKCLYWQLFLRRRSACVLLLELGKSKND